QTIEEIAARTFRSRGGRRATSSGLRNFVLDRTNAGHTFLLRKAKERILARTKGKYPAPLAILDVVGTGMDKGPRRGYEAEARAFGQLARSVTARHLMQLFFSANTAKKDPLSTPSGTPLRSFERLGIVGAGSMGIGLAAQILHRRALPLQVHDLQTGNLTRCLAAVDQYLGQQVALSRLPRHRLPLLRGLLSTTTSYEGFRHADLIFEAVPEELGLKREVLHELEQVNQGRAVLASCTSSLPIKHLVPDLAHPEQVLGMHFCSPVATVQLLEVVRRDENPAELVRSAVAFGRTLGKHVIVVNDGAGFYTSRCLAAYLNEAAHLFFEGYRVEDLDKTMLEWGFPVGPMSLLDELGLDLATRTIQLLHQTFGTRMEPPEGWDLLLTDGRLGRKALKGFYTYSRKRGKTGRVDPTVYNLRPPTVTTLRNPDLVTVTRRLVLAFVNEAMHCFHDGTLRTPSDGDLGAVFGVGFPAYLGGPFSYLDHCGAARVVGELDDLANRFGDRFRPSQILCDSARAGATFHGARS
ncbi:MAG: hypothetical protein A2284_09290, partial [Deltaproteobacteria bacterium RIFOXYA12_FULL_61_11]